MLAISSVSLQRWLMHIQINTYLSYLPGTKSSIWYTPFTLFWLITNTVNQKFSKWGVHQNYLAGLLVHRLPGPTPACDSVSQGWGLRGYISNKFPGVAAVAGLGTTPGEPLVKITLHEFIKSGFIHFHGCVVFHCWAVWLHIKPGLPLRLSPIFCYSK